MTGSDHTPAARRPRTDAVRNRQRVAEAAVTVFAERGLGATMAEVAERAKVGNATVFRNFPTKGALLGEVATRWLDDWGAEVARRLADESRTDALPGLIDGVMERLRRDRLALDILRAGNADDRMGAARDEVERLFTEAIRRGIAAGLVDPTITYADLSLLILGTAARLFEMGETRPVAWRRASALVRAATRV